MLTLLSIYFNTFGSNDEILNNPQYIHNPDSWFNNQGGRHYITGEFERQVILDIDKSKVISENVLENPIFGGISSLDISTTSKTVILVKNQPEYIFNGSRMGDNAAPWLLKIGNIENVTIRLGYIMHFKEPFTILIANTNRIVSTWNEYVQEALRFL